MDLGLKGKVAMVAAGTRGIGLACASALAREGARVSVCGINPDSIRAAGRSLGRVHRAYSCDVRSKPDLERWFERTVEELGEPDIVVTNTGGPPAGPAGSLSDEKWQEGFESTVLNAVRLSRLASPLMIERRWGRIVHLTSLVAKDPEPLLAVSSTLRAGLSALTRLQARELGPRGITVNAVLPGNTDTDRQTHLLELRAKEAGITVRQARERASAGIPVGRLARPEEIGDVVAFLCSERAGYVSGAVLAVDGGLTRGLG